MRLAEREQQKGREDYLLAICDGLAYDAANRLLQEIRGFTDQATATTDCTWDEAGKMLSKTTPAGTITYNWNYDKRLLSGTDPSGQVTTYGYTPFGIRVRMTDPNGTKRFLYNKEDIIAEFDAANTQTACYIHGPLIDEPW